MRWLARTIVAVLGLAGIVATPAPATASCVGPILKVVPAAATPGSIVVVTGEFFVGACNDVIINGQVAPPTPPPKGIVVSLVMGAETFPLATVDADASYGFRLDAVQIPASAHVGSGVLRASIPTAGLPETAETPFGVLPIPRPRPAPPILPNTGAGRLVAFISFAATCIALGAALVRYGRGSASIAARRDSARPYFFR